MTDTRKLAGGAAAILVAAIISITSTHHAPAVSNAPPPAASGLYLQLSCQLGYGIAGQIAIVPPDLDMNVEPGTFTTVDPEDQQGGYSAAIQVTATNDNAVSVAATGVNVALYDASGDLLTTTSADLGLAAIAAGVTVTNAVINSLAPGAVSCQTTTYNS